MLLANYWKRLTIPTAWLGAVVNIHGSLLPAFGGRGYYGTVLYQAVVDSGVQYTGATLHWATDKYDIGDITLQARVRIDPHNTVALVQRKTEYAEVAITTEWLKTEKMRRALNDSRITLPVVAP